MIQKAHEAYNSGDLTTTFKLYSELDERDYLLIKKEN